MNGFGKMLPQLETHHQPSRHYCVVPALVHIHSPYSGICRCIAPEAQKDILTARIVEDKLHIHPADQCCITHGKKKKKKKSTAIYKAFICVRLADVVLIE